MSKPVKKRIDAEKTIKFLWVFYIGLGLLFGAVAYQSAILVNPKSDLLNITSLIIEVGFGIAITITVYLYSKRTDEQSIKQQDKISKLVEKIEKVIEEQAKAKDERKKIALDWIKSALEFILSETYYQRAILAKFYESRMTGDYIKKYAKWHCKFHSKCDETV